MTSSHQQQYAPSSSEVRDAFADEIASLGGTIVDEFEHEERLLFLRAVLAADADLQLGDKVNAGVAVRATGPSLVVHPYTFRQVCSNGAIVTQALESQHFERVHAGELYVPAYETSVTLAAFREAIRDCASPRAFARATAEMRSTIDARADEALQLLPALSRAWGHLGPEVLQSILRRFESDGDRSAFGVVNAVTSTARDSRDPETRWQLEAIGGAIAARLARQSRTTPAAVGVGA